MNDIILVCLKIANIANAAVSVGWVRAYNHRQCHCVAVFSGVLQYSARPVQCNNTIGTSTCYTCHGT